MKPMPSVAIATGRHEIVMFSSIQKFQKSSENMHFLFATKKYSVSTTESVTDLFGYSVYQQEVWHTVPTNKW